jgi:hypothetical protein
MFDSFKQKAANLGQKFLVKVGKAEELKEDEDFTTKIQNFKQTRLGMMKLVQTGKRMLDAMTAETTAKLAFVCRSLLLFCPSLILLFLPLNSSTMISWNSLGIKSISIPVLLNIVCSSFV